MTVVMDLGLKANGHSSRRRLILVKGDAQLGLLADRVDGVLALKPKKVRPIAQGKDSVQQQRQSLDGTQRLTSRTASGEYQYSI
jgi:chemotaxis signal transduction protein